MLLLLLSDRSSSYGPELTQYSVDFTETFPLFFLEQNNLIEGTTQ